ncbi:MAG: DUF1275 domain-containing protein [Phycisphaerae bacterium]|nr:DUF1275 domain-containing protein [Saprospiraceae bacterium]
MKIDFLETIKAPFFGPEGATVRKRSFRRVMLNAIAYPFSTGIVIYAGLMTFSMVLTNITGFLPQIAKDLYEGQLNTAGSIFLWLFAFFMGGFFAGWCSEREKLLKTRYLHLIPLLAVVLIYAAIAISGQKTENLHPVAFPSMILFTIGVLNAMVSLTTSSLIKASQMTGMVVELGVDVAELFHSEGEKHRLIRREAWLRIVVMCSFIGGAMMSVAIFPIIGTKVFYIPSGIVAGVMLHDLFRY